MLQTGRSITPRSQGESYIDIYIPDMPVSNSRMRRKVRLRRDNSLTSLVTVYILCRDRLHSYRCTQTPLACMILQNRNALQLAVAHLLRVASSLCNGVNRWRHYPALCCKAHLFVNRLYLYALKTSGHPWSFRRDVICGAGKEQQRLRFEYQSLAV